MTKVFLKRQRMLFFEIKFDQENNLSKPF